MTVVHALCCYGVSVLSNSILLLALCNNVLQSLGFAPYLSLSFSVTVCVVRFSNFPPILLFSCLPLMPSYYFTIYNYFLWPLLRTALLFCSVVVCCVLPFLPAFRYLNFSSRYKQGLISFLCATGYRLQVLLFTHYLM